jgi:curved DNA-binding protein CbpA
MATLERFTDATQAPFLTKGLAQFGADYYAVLGVPLDAPLAEIRKSYRNIARLLHPDRFVRDMAGKDEAERILARLVNPAFEVLSSESQRRDYDRLIQNWGRRMLERKETLPTLDKTMMLMQSKTTDELQTVYRKAIFEQSLNIYKDQTDLTIMLVANELSIQNLGFVITHCRVATGDGFSVATMPPRTRNPAAPSTQQPVAPPTATPAAATPKSVALPKTNFAASHFERGKNLLDRRLYKEAVNSLKEACRIDASNAEYHAYLGQAYLRQGLPGMAKAEFTQALSINPNEPVAKKEMSKVATSTPAAANAKTTQATGSKKTAPAEEDKGALKKLWDQLNKPL